MCLRKEEILHEGLQMNHYGAFLVTGQKGVLKYDNNPGE